MIQLFWDNKIIGLTGMSGAGKTTACEIFASGGFRVINCDKVTREVEIKGTRCYNDVVAFFGEGILSDDGELNRRKIASIIFGDMERKIEYERIVFPYITYRVFQYMAKYKSEYILLDAPTLYESGLNDMCECVVAVVADENTSIRRIMMRDSIDRASATKRISAQKSKPFFQGKADYCVENDGDLDALHMSLLQIINQIRGEYGEQNSTN